MTSELKNRFNELLENIAKVFKEASEYVSNKANKLLADTVKFDYRIKEKLEDNRVEVKLENEYGSTLFEGEFKIEGYEEYYVRVYENFVEYDNYFEANIKKINNDLYEVNITRKYYRDDIVYIKADNIVELISELINHYDEIYAIAHCDYSYVVDDEYEKYIELKDFVEELAKNSKKKNIVVYVSHAEVTDKEDYEYLLIDKEKVKDIENFIKRENIKLI
jgi:hypothetical protein